MVYAGNSSAEYLHERGWKWIRGSADAASGWRHEAFECDRSQKRGTQSLFLKVKMHVRSSGGGISLPSCQSCGKDGCSLASKRTSRRYHWRRGVWVGSDVENKSGDDPYRMVVMKDGKKLKAKARIRLSISAPTRNQGSSQEDVEGARAVSTMDTEEDQLDLSFYPEHSDSWVPDPEPLDTDLDGQGGPAMDHGNDSDGTSTLDHITAFESSRSKKVDEGEDADTDVTKAEKGVEGIGQGLDTLGHDFNVDDVGIGMSTGDHPSQRSTTSSVPPPAPPNVTMPISKPKFSASERDAMRGLLEGMLNSGWKTEIRSSASRLLDSLGELEKGESETTSD